jgi:hypothetical protein
MRRPKRPYHKIPLYRGVRTPAGPRLWIYQWAEMYLLSDGDGYHDRFDWGSDGYACRRLAASLLEHALGRKPPMADVQRFLREVVALQPYAGFELDREAIWTWFDRSRADRA